MLLAQYMEKYPPKGEKFTHRNICVNFSDKCDLACNYCYQTELNQGKTISDETLDDIARYINAYSYDDMSLTFTGKERWLSSH